MPARKPDAPRTPAGRLSRAFVTELHVTDLAKVERTAEEAARLALVEIGDPIDRLYAAASLADAGTDELEKLREERNRLAVILWAFQRARGSNLQAAAGMKNTYLNRIKMEHLGVTAIPKVPGTEAVDFDAIRDRLAARGLEDDPGAKDRLLEVVTRIAFLEGQATGAREVRDHLALDLVQRGATKASVGAMISRTPWQVGRMVQQAEQEEARRGARPRKQVEEAAGAKPSRRTTKPAARSARQVGRDKAREKKQLEQQEQEVVA